VARLCSLLGAVLLVALAALAPASLAADPAPSGGVEYDGVPGTTRPSPPDLDVHGASGRPVATRFAVPERAISGAPVEIGYRVDATASRVRVRLAVYRSRRHQPIMRLDLGLQPTGTERSYRWPVAPPAGTYRVLLHAVDSAGLSLARSASASGRARLVVTPPIAPDGNVPVAIAPEAAPTPASLSGTFPVQGPHDFGGADARFGATRAGHVHQGQDVLAAEGTPVLAPRPGTVTWRSFQRSGAGYYLVLHDDAAPRDYVFMHLRRGSLLVDRGDRVAAGQPLGQVGSTGISSAPHLHFEIWVGGWYAKGGAPVDPLPQLRAWDG
jgi:murein DD-endopeptidase MepM/ murein hydrolase activator NlpD